MEKFEKTEETYSDRIRRFVEYLKNIDADWITKRLWFEDLKTFELGESFFYKVLFADDTTEKEKGDFYTGILIYAMINLEKKVRTQQDHVEAGFQIERELDIEDEEENHEALLGYLWWKTIYKKANKAGQFSKEQVIVLEKKQKGFEKRINRIDSLAQ